MHDQNLVVLHWNENVDREFSVEPARSKGTKNTTRKEKL